MSDLPLPGRLADVWMDGELPRREDVPPVFDELDYQLACQVLRGLWKTPPGGPGGAG